MVARRLLIVMLILVGISTILPALVPPPATREDTSSTTTTSDPPATAEDGRLVRRTIKADVSRPTAVKLELGDQLSLKVTSRRFAEISIPKLGLLAEAVPGSPARFDILADEEGEFAVERRPKARLAVLQVRERESPAG